MKTAVEELEEYLKWTGVVIERPDTRCILQEEINKAKEKEKQQIVDAYIKGNYKSNRDMYWKKEDANKYYNEEYEN